jgi:hypothetical protein
MLVRRMGAQMIEEGWRQIEAGVALIVWSRLAFWDPQNLSLVASKESDFESRAGHKEVHGQFGRLICWIEFGVGAEYLAKGVCILRGCDLTGQTKCIRLPQLGEDIDNWIQLVNENDQSIHESELSFGTLAKLPLGQILKPGQERDLVLASIKLLASTIRNRDAHRYAQNVRTFHFHLVKSLFVPAFNILLASLDKGELRIRFSESGFSGQDNA